ncbi:MAG TPA: alanine racemase [Clostridiales bacterium]|jgi:alanine racemase|nr:alanine racemase [Clostridiales bacterium]
MSKYLVVERQKVRNNIAQIRKKAGTAEVYGVLKGNAYGFGLLEMAHLLREEGVSSFAVTEVRDLVILRNAGFIDEEILMLRSTALEEELTKLIEYHAVCTVGSYEAAVALNGLADAASIKVEAHIKLDTGMGRYGFLPEETDKIISIFKYMSALQITGLYTHFNKAFSSKKAVEEQLDQLNKVADAIRSAGYSPGKLHAANSSALLKYPQTVLDAVRVGSALTGRVAVRGNFGLQKAGTAQCPVVEIRWLPKNHTVGYGGDFKCRQMLRAATVPMGYADGFCTDKQRDMFNFKNAVMATLSAVKAWGTGRQVTAQINGKTVPVIGHVGMQHCVLDVTDVECQVGDMAVFEVNPIIAGAILPKRYE